MVFVLRTVPEPEPTSSSGHGLCHVVSSLHRRQYHFINQLKTWPEAQRYCREKHADLATINDEEDIRELTGLVGSGFQYAHVGLYRGWTWSLSDTDDYKEGEPVYWNWASGQPSSGQPATRLCGSMGVTGEWFATNCSTGLSFFCYDSHITDISGRFTLVSSSMNWHDAQVYCREQHTDLATVRNQVENDQLHKMLNGNQVWIGLTGMSWMWSDGSEPSFITWRQDEPYRGGIVPLRKHLVSLKMTAGDSSVDMEYPAVLDSILKQVEGKLGGLCHVVSCLYERQYHFINQLKTWPEAQRYCREKHTDLATINDEEDIRELTGLVGSGFQYAHVGLYRGWTWSLSDTDDYKEGEPVYWNWASGQPSSGQPATRLCGSMGAMGEWFATSCGTGLSFFCYDSHITDISGRFTLVSSSMNWHNAQVYCREQHTDLATVRNQVENDQLQKMLNGNQVWIGLTGMSWMWSDGSEPSFVTWRQDEPYRGGIVPLRKHLVSLKMTAGDSSVDMEDPAVLDSILKQVEGKLRDKVKSPWVKLSWKKLPQKI
ncbi:uncharacterized protein AKAME5_001620300 [Lates japonicus]|uniref:C-type lectin domain-containing protein n=1 Tax=Lates japonicus TaxID=270547 RepID=A0AAD3N480_LATJO|nr:uncharacterized protein AKAME5_001620300 [Lates japonicus]